MSPRPRAVALLLALALLVGCLGSAEDAEPAPQESQTQEPDLLPRVEIPPLLEPEPEPVRFLAWGDSGAGNDVQRAVAQAAEQVCEREGCDFALLLGDNVYPDGVRNETDPQFVDKFEAPYENLSVPFYASLGNHDVGMGALPGSERDNGDFQVRYALRTDRPTDKWRMPGRHYAFTEGPVQVVVLDLTRLAREGSDVALEEAQLAWTNRTWDPDAPWRIAVSHFPYVSNGKHGHAGSYDGVPGRGAALREALERVVCRQAHLYLAGHDHDLQWLRPVPSCGDTEFVVSGAAAKPRPLRGWNASAWWEAGDVAGFFWFEATADTLVGRAYDVNGTVLYERTLRKDAGG